MAVKASVDDYVIDVLLEEMAYEFSVGSVVARDRISPIEKLVTGQANYFDFLLKKFRIGEIVYVRSNDNHAVSLLGQHTSEVLSVFFYTSDVGKIVGRKYAEGFFHNPNRFFVFQL